MPRVRVRNVDVYYEIHGEGPQLFFIGGSGGDLRDKPNVFEGPLVEHFEVLSFDQRGLGRSDVPPGPYTMADYAGDAAALLDALAFAPCLVMGVSFGGMVAQELACRHPDKITRIVLACTSPGGAGGASYPLHELQDMPEDEALPLMLEISDTRYNAQWRTANPEAASKMMDLARTRSQRDEAAQRGQRLQFEARKSHDTFDRLCKVTHPVYITAGRYDGIAPPINQQALLRALPNARLDMFEGGHLFLMQDPSAFAQIDAFLRAAD